jgi:hypothetical protein
MCFTARMRVVLFIPSISPCACSSCLGGARSYLSGGTKVKMAARDTLHVTTWNIAAINNNPFEYWITYKESPDYEQLMINVEKFLENPGDDQDILVNQVFTDAMFTRLNARMTSESINWPSVQSYWESDYSKRRIVSGFLKDKMLGSKRLASMPDRITNTINVASTVDQVYRPTVINMYEDDLSSIDVWWNKWESFMFDEKLPIKNKDGVVERQAPYEMLQKIKKAKYPEITAQEESDSLPLQTLCGAIFDAILVHMMNTVSQPDVWQPLKRIMVKNLNKQKVPKTLEILTKQYVDSDIITLQEVSMSLVDQIRSNKQTGSLGKQFHVITPQAVDVARDQNSVILLSKRSFPSLGSLKEITTLVRDQFPASSDVPVADGDILAIATNDAGSVPYVIVSFHGDTNGLATKPVLEAVLSAMKVDKSLSDHTLIFGLDANTYENAVPGKQQDVMAWGESYVSHGLTSCWGDVPQPTNYTTYNARTFLQPQLNKACRSAEKRSKGDVNPKDFILFPKAAFSVLYTWKDNTGQKRYLEDTPFPTLEFPSDHGILSTILQPTKK